MASSIQAIYCHMHNNYSDAVIDDEMFRSQPPPYSVTDKNINKMVSSVVYTCAVLISMVYM